MALLRSSAETPGASVMAWILRDRLPPNRCSASATSNGFDAIRESILRLGTRDLSDSALKRLHWHDRVEERTRQDEIEAREAHRVQREKLKDACCQLKEAIKAYRAAYYERNTTGTAAGHLARVIIQSLAVIDELGLGPTLNANAQRKDRQLLSGKLEASQVGYIKDELRMHLALIKCRNKSEAEIVSLLAEFGLLSPSSCDDLWIDLWHYDQFTDVQERKRG